VIENTFPEDNVTKPAKNCVIPLGKRLPITFDGQPPTGNAQAESLAK
jgi:hypothetical protein